MKGICRLCLRDRELRLSHVWPSFLYKDYVADMSKGGQVLKLFTGIEEGGRQVKRPWFCSACEQRIGESESAVAPLLRRMGRKRDVPHRHDAQLLRFATSISWRVMHLCRETLNRGLLEDAFPAVRYWRRFLDGSRADLAGFTQHVFPFFDDKTGMHRMLMGCVRDGFVISQAGPLLIVGRLDGRSGNEAAIWKRSEVPPGPGNLTAITSWQVGQSITLGLMRALTEEQRRMFEAMLKRGYIQRRQDGEAR